MAGQGRPPRIAWIGLGNMGRPMTANIVRKSVDFTPPLILFNRTRSRAEEHAETLPADKVIVADRVEDTISGADIIFTMLTADDALRETVQQMLKASESVKGRLIVDCSTISPKTANDVAKILNDAGAEFVAMPVVGTTPVATAGQLVCMPAGPKHCVERIRPFVQGIVARTFVDLSEKPQGNASVLKLLANSFSFAMLNALSEAHVVAEKSGVGSDILHQYVEAAMPGSSYAALSRFLVSGAYYKSAEPLIDINLGHKDTDILLGIAAENGARMRMLETGKSQLDKAQDHATKTGIKGDLAHVYGVARMDGGLPFENGRR